MSSSLALLLLLLSATLACTRLMSGLQDKGTGSRYQDKGGIYLIIAVKAEKAQLDQSLEQTVAVVEKRCDQLGIYCKLQRQGGDRIMLRISSSLESGRVKSILLGEGMEMRAVVSPPSPAPVQQYPTQAEAAVAAGTDHDVLPFATGETAQSFLVVERTPIVTGQDVRRAEAVSGTSGPDDHRVTFLLNPEGAVKLQDWTRANINNYLAIVLNKRVRSTAYIKSMISDNGEISGRFTKEEAEDTAMMLMSGNLPAPVEVLEEGTYKP